jgi:hypothetical protein
MVDIPTAIAASIIGAVVAGMISGVVNLISLGIQYRLNRNHRQWMERFEWHRETNATVRQLRRHTLQLDMSDPDLNAISELIKELEIQIDHIPDTYSGTALNTALNDIQLVYKNYEDSDDDTAIIDLRTKMLTATETAEAIIDDEF